MTTSAPIYYTRSRYLEEVVMDHYQPSPYSLQNLIRVINQNFGVIVIALVMFGAGFFGGSIWTENKILKNGGGSAVAAAPSVPSQPGGPTAPQQPKPAGDVPKVTEADHTRGNKNAKLTLVEYSDFECPFCARFHPTMQQVMKEYGDKVKWVYRHYPLSFHPNAQKAAEGSECVAKLGGNDAFWKYGDALFAENDKLGGKLSPESITTAAQASGVNQDAFKKCLDSGEMAQKVKDDMAGGTTAGVSGTPGTIIINKDGKTELISGALPFEQIKQAIDRNL